MSRKTKGEDMPLKNRILCQLVLLFFYVDSGVPPHNYDAMLVDFFYLISVCFPSTLMPFK